MKVAVIGSRTFKNYSLLRETLDNYYPQISLIVSGGARGADSLGEKYAKEEGIQTLIFKPEWDKYGKSAGMIRNKYIIDNADLVVAYWDGLSKGTKDSIDYATKLNKKLNIIKF